MTTYTFADRYSEAGINPSAEKILSREGPVRQIVDTINDQQIMDLAMFYYGCSGIDLDWFRNAFVETDASFSMVNNEREARVLSALVLSELIKLQSTNTILAISLGSVRGLRLPPQSSWLVYEAEKAFLACAVEDRSHEAIPSKVSPTFNQKLTDELVELAAAGDALDTKTLVDLLNKVREEARSSAVTTSKQVSAALEKCDRQLSMMREESQMLWWLTGGVSKTLSRSFTTFTPAQAALIGALDLGKLTTYTHLGPVAIPAILDKIIALAKKTRTQTPHSLSTLVDSFVPEDLEQFNVSNKLSPYIAPVTAAINFAKTSGAGVWHARFAQTTGLEASLLLEPVMMAEQLYREHLLGQLM
ncbi:GTPase-associated system all-helical protein GASH [Pectobacterium polaris]|uniref:GTPase-associated system all-helical protein GASH n=1 Tax=Pectobacterium polaris TaxID=2042057 RepID=UPI001583C618|nr:GTPase-associated system all-helical protein GASH [Pectobacterium polaris]